MATKITNATALVKKEWSSTPQTGYESMHGNVTNGSLKAALDDSETIVLYSPDGKVKNSKIYGMGREFGTACAGVDTTSNTFSSSGTEYSIVLTDDGLIKVTQYIALTSISASGATEWERDSAAHKNVTWTASPSPGSPSGTITYSWNVGTPAGATVGTNSGKTLTFTSIPTNAATSATCTATQTFSGKANVVKTTTKTCTYWSRRFIIFTNASQNLKPASSAGASNVVGITTGGFAFNIANTLMNAQTATSGAGWVMAADKTAFNKNGGSYTFGSASANNTYIYVLTADDLGSSWSAKVAPIGGSAMAALPFNKVTTSGVTIKTYNGGTLTLYLYVSASTQGALSSISFKQ